MKKILILLLCGFMMIGCSQTNNNENEQNNPVSVDENNEKMTIKPAEFSSEETYALFKLFEYEMAIFDISINDSVKSFIVTVWFNQDGEWQERQKTYGSTEYFGNRYAVRYVESSLHLYSIDDDGYTRTGFTELNTDHDDASCRVWRKLDYEETIELNKEIPLFIYVAKEETFYETSEMYGDFRNIDCLAGIAVTITFSDEIVE